LGTSAASGCNRQPLKALQPVERWGLGPTKNLKKNSGISVEGFCDQTGDAVPPARELGDSIGAQWNWELRGAQHATVHQANESPGHWAESSLFWVKRSDA